MAKGKKFIFNRDLSPKFRNIENLTVEKMLAELNSKEEQFIDDPKFRADLLELERLAYKKAAMDNKDLKTEDINSNQDSIVERQRAEYRNSNPQPGPAKVTREDKKESNLKTINIQRKMENENFLIDAIRSRISKRSFSRDSQLVHDRGREAMINAGLEHLVSGNSICIPIEEQRATVTASSGPVGKDEIYALPSPASKTIFAEMGATILQGLTSDVEVPSMSAVNTSFLDENEDVGSDLGPTLSGISLSPRRNAGWFDLSNQMLKQGGAPASKYVADCILGSGASSLEACVTGVTARSTKKPSGMGIKLASTAASVPTLASILGMEADLASIKALQGKMAFLTSPLGKKILKTNRKDVGLNESLMEKGLLNDYPVYVSQHVSDAAGSGGNGSLLVLANWQDLCIAQWGAYLITVDTVTLAKYYRTKIFVNCFFDVRGLRFPESGTDYYVGFSMLPIKLS